MIQATTLPPATPSCPRAPADMASEWLAPLGAMAPCGPSLEYDPEYAVLLSRMSPRGDAQYGAFVDTPGMPPWAEIERDCRRLLLRSRDINLLVWLCRARARLAQAAGLAQALSTLAAMLQAWPEAIHPQLIVEGERDPAVRVNALAALADPEGLLGDVREIVVVANAARHLTVRDVERAWAWPRPAGAASPESMAQQLAQLHRAAKDQAEAPVRQLAQAARAAEAVAVWAASQWGDDAPPLQALVRLLKLFEAPEPAAEVAAPDAPSPRRPATGVGIAPGTLLTRDDTQRCIRTAREWFEIHEPSSPVAVLLKQAERMVGQRFSRVADAIPLDLLRKWDEGEDMPG